MKNQYILPSLTSTFYFLVLEKIDQYQKIWRGPQKVFWITGILRNSEFFILKVADMEPKIL